MAHLLQVVLGVLQEVTSVLRADVDQNASGSEVSALAFDVLQT